MSYQKILVDNTICSRRFHVTFDDESTSVDKVELHCPHCNAVVFKASNHPPAIIARDENMIKTAQLSRDLMRTCSFQDPFRTKK
jgi:hypothetical protein